MVRREFTERPELRGLASSLARHWTDGPVAFVRHFVNAVYRLPGTPPAYLRITPETHRSRAQIESELQLLRHVEASGVAASQPVVSRSDEVIHAATTNDTTYLACVFTEAPGVPFLESPPQDRRTFFRTAGKTMGLLHEALSRFEPPPDFVRPGWMQDRWHRFAELVPETEVEARELWAELHRWTDQLPGDPSEFGLIHGDFTIANLRLDGPRVTLFDFDACCEHWRAYEIATFLHYFGGQDAGAREVAYDAVLDGYAEARPVTAAFLQQIPLFGKMRLLYSFLVFAEEWGFTGLSAEQSAYFEIRRRAFRSPPTWPGARNREGRAPEGGRGIRGLGQHAR